MIDDERTVVTVEIAPLEDAPPIRREFEVETVAEREGDSDQWVLEDESGFPRAVLNTDEMREITTELFDRKDDQGIIDVRAPDGWGNECPVCGEPFDADSAGVIWADEPQETDAISWVRMCTADVAEHLRELVEDLGYDPDQIAMLYVHKDEHIDVIGDQVAVSEQEVDL